MKHTATVDRIEEDLAVLEVGGQFVHWPISELPSGVREGSVLAFSFELSDTGDRRLEQAEARLERLRTAGPSDDEIDL